MNELPLHPALVHLPLGVGLVAPLVAAFLLFAWSRGAPKRGWLLAAALQGVVFIGALAAMQAGEEDEERVEHAISEEALHEHEELGESFVTLSGIVFALAVLPLFLRRERLAQGLAAASVLGGLGLAGLGVAVGEAGGELVYVHGAGAAWSGGGAVAPDHDDDND